MSLENRDKRYRKRSFCSSMGDDWILLEQKDILDFIISFGIENCIDVHACSANIKLI